MTQAGHPERSTEAFFGRRRGKRLRPQQLAALEEVLPRLRVNLASAAPEDLRTLFACPVQDVRLEIGFGGGEHLLAELQRHPATGFLGVEPFVNGMAKLAAALEGRAPPNLRLYDDDATQLLEWLPDASLVGIDLFYPDPWPKKRHWKRRFVSPVNLDRFARVLRPGAKFRFASDIPSYVNWTLLACRIHPAFSWEAASADDWRVPFVNWPGTRYEEKAVREGRRPAYLTFTRV
ncbi:tRNA (guanosine(46)-N(7))-methyltransferase TrmB [Chelativorans sp.]|uniref:tRNA (guanine(46)-N(7))-methyltransferase TrmB n=1 Tax=Chelativorans sp. TaxID=2203393 RepID=UPI0028128B41|nr:tRNA (guanosine(46)-N(7))-methyltransferase TrmB [Chelativorans sp.]